MSDPFGRTNLLINKLVGRTYHNPLGRVAFRSAAKMSALGTSSRVLDVGTGRGYGAVYLAKTFGCRVTGIDISDAMLAEAQNQAGKLRKVSFRKTSLTRFRANHPFDLVCCFDVLGFVSKRGSAIRHLANLLKEGGSLAWSDYFYTRKTPAVRRLMARWNLKSIGLFDSIRKEMKAVNLKIVRYENTTDRYRKHWLAIRKRLTGKEEKICRKVGNPAFERYREAVDAILDATAEGSFGHISGIAVKNLFSGKIRSRWYIADSSVVSH